MSIPSSSSSPLPSPLWAAIETDGTHVCLLLSVPMAGTSLKARLPAEPAHDRAVLMLMEALALWYGRPLHVVIDADGSDVSRHPERWALLLGDPPASVEVEWVAVPRPRRHDRFLESMGEFATGRQLVSFAATGQR
jgi:hypothetical protein